MDSNETVLKVLIGRAFHPSILLKIFKMDSLYYFEAKINNSAGNFGRVQFHITKEISDSAFNSYFKSIQEMNFFNFKPNPVNEGINDGSGYFVEVNVRGKHHYVIRLTPYLIKENQIRPNQNELVEINQLCDRLFELSGCREVFEPIY